MVLVTTFRPYWLRDITKSVTKKEGFLLKGSKRVAPIFIQRFKRSGCPLQQLTFTTHTGKKDARVSFIVAVALILDDSPQAFLWHRYKKHEYQRSRVEDRYDHSGVDIVGGTFLEVPAL